MTEPGAPPRVIPAKAGIRLATRESGLSTPNTYAANPQKVKPFIWRESVESEFIFCENAPQMKKAGACDSGLFGVRRENLN